MADKKLDIIGSFKGENLINGLKKTQVEVRVLKDAVKGFSSAIGASAGAFAVYQMSKKVIELDSAMVKLRNTGHLSAGEMYGWKNNIFDVAQATGNTVDDVTKLSTAALSSSHNAKFVSQEMGFMSKMMAASGVSAEVLGENLGDISKESGLTGKAFEEMIGKLVGTSAMAGVETNFEKLLPDIPSLIRTFKADPSHNPAKLGEFLTMAMFTPNPMAMNKGLRQMQRTLTKADLRFLKLTPKDMADMDFKKVIDAVDKATTDPQKRANILQKIFGKGSFDIGLMTRDWDKFTAAVKGGTLASALEMADNKAHSLSGSFNALSTIGLRFADSALSPALDAIAKSLQEIDPETIKELTEVFTGLGKAIGETAKWTMTFIAAMNELLTGHLEKDTNKRLASAAQRTGIVMEQAEAIQLDKAGQHENAASVRASAKAQRDELEHPTVAAEKAREAAKHVYNVTSTGFNTVPNVKNDIAIYLPTGERVEPEKVKSQMKITGAYGLAIAQ